MEDDIGANMHVIETLMIRLAQLAQLFNGYERNAHCLLYVSGSNHSPHCRGNLFAVFGIFDVNNDKKV